MSHTCSKNLELDHSFEYIYASTLNIKIVLLVNLCFAAQPKIWYPTRADWGNFIHQKTIPNMFRWNSAFQQYRECSTRGASSPLWISVSVSLAFDKWDGRRWRRKGNVLKQKWEGGWKRGILWLDVMHASVCVHCVVQVSGFYLSEGKHWGMHTSGQMQILRPRCKSYHVL